jgi:hypothetical protein
MELSRANLFRPAGGGADKVQAQADYRMDIRATIERLPGLAGG